MLTPYSGRLVTVLEGHSWATDSTAVTSRSVTSTSTCSMSDRAATASPPGSSCEAVVDVGGASSGRRSTVPLTEKVPSAASAPCAGVDTCSTGSVVSTGSGVQSVGSPGVRPRSGCGQSHTEPVEDA